MIAQDEVEVTAGPVRPIGRPIDPDEEATWLIASTGRRVAAYVVDLLVVFALSTGITYVLGATIGSGLGGPNPFNPGDLPQAAVTVISTGLDLVYFVGLWVLLGRTAGMRLLGLRLVSAADGGRLDLRHGLLRWVAITWPYALVIVDMLDPTLAALTSLVTLGWFIVLLVGTARGSRHQGPHDRLAGSIMLHGAGRPWPPTLHRSRPT